MFRVLKPRSSKRGSILDKQRVKGKASGRGPAPRLSWSIAAKGLLIVFACVVLWGIGLRVADKVQELTAYLNSIIVLPPREWRIEIVTRAQSPLPEEIRREIYKVASKHLRQGSPGELRSLARAVEGLGMLDGVHVIRPLADTVILSAEIRRPVMLVSVGQKTRFLTAEGTVYGDSSDNTGNPSLGTPRVLLTGIFEQRPNPVIDGSLRVIVAPDERRHLLDGLEIFERSTAANLEVKSISFQRFRGFAITLSDDTEVVIGISPFEYKLKKLHGLLDGLKRDGVIATRIELDYEGKAFIKERKL